PPSVAGRPALVPSVSSPSLLPLDEGLERAGPVRAAQLAERLRLDLPDTLARDREALADLFEGVVGLLADAEAQTQDLLFARREGGEDFSGLLFQREGHGCIGGRERLPVLDEIAERALLVIADRGLERY